MLEMTRSSYYGCARLKQAEAAIVPYVSQRVIKIVLAGRVACVLLKDDGSRLKRYVFRKPYENAYLVGQFSERPRLFLVAHL